MKTGRKTNFAVMSCVLFCMVTVAQVSAQSTSRGMQTAPPRQTYDNQSPRVIDFTNIEKSGRQASRSGNTIDFTNSRNNSINPQTNNAALRSGSRQIPLQNMPFGERTQPQSNFAELFSNKSQQANEFQNSGRNVIQKANEASKQFWRNAGQSLQIGQRSTPKFNLPANLNRKPNYTENQRLTDSNPLADRFKLPALQKPAWIKKIDDRAKGLLGRKNDLQQAGTDLTNRINGTRQNANQAWQNFTQGGISAGTAQPNGSAPAARSANNDWLNQAQQSIFR